MGQIAGNNVPRFLVRLVALAGCVLVVSYCGEQGRFGPGPAGPGGDTENPVVTVTFPGGPADTVVDITDSLKFTVRVTDNARVAAIQVRVAGLAGFSLDTTVLDTTITTATTDVTRSFTLPLPATSAGQRLAITVTAADAIGNTATTTVNVVIEDPQPPVITIKQPSGGVTVPAGGTLAVVGKAVDPSGIRQMGARIFSRNALGQPIAIAGDSQTYTAPLVTSKTDTFLVRVPFSLVPGTYPLHVFAVDGSAGANDTTSADISISVADTLRPFGSFSLPLTNASIVAGDSVLLTFRARDSTAVQSVSFRGISQRGNAALGTDTTVLRFFPKTATFAALPRDTTISRYLNAVLTDSTPEPVFLEATITDIGGNTALVRDTIQLVAGPFVRITSPATGSQQPVGTPLAVTVTGRDPDKLKALGFVATGAAPGADSIVYSSPLPVTNTTVRTLSVSATAPLGTDTITPFARDSLGNRFIGSPIIVSFVDTVRPSVTIVSPTLVDTQVTAGDSVLMRVTVSDNRGVSQVTLVGRSRRGVDSLGTGVTVARFQQKTVTLALPTSATFSRFLNAVPTDSTAENVYLVVEAQDSAGNVRADSIRIRITAGPFVRVTAPAAGSRQPVGVPVSITVNGFDPDSLTYLGFAAAGVATATDSLAISPRATNATRTLSLPTTATTPIGEDTIRPFARDRFGNRFTGLPIVISFQDTVRPTVTIQQPAVAALPVALGDSLFVQVRVQDNRGVTQINLSGVSQRGVASLGTDTVVTRFSPKSVTIAPNIDTTITRYLRMSPTDSASETVLIIVDAQDSSGNASSDTATVLIVDGPRVAVLAPADSSLASPGKSITIQVRGIDPNGVRILGWAATGVVNKRDSTIFSPVNSALPDTNVFSSNLLVPVGTPAGTITVAPFGRDSVGDPSGTVPGITIIVQTTAVDVLPPLVQFTVDSRVEVDDTITVRGTDPGGISRVGFIARNISTGVVVRGDSVNFPGTVSNISQIFSLRLDTVSTFPRQVTVEAFAIDSVGNRGVSTFTTAKTSPADAETLTVVAGKTIALPAGGSIGDAIYNSNRNELYLTNTTLNRLEIFQLADSTFAPPIPVGSRPVGIALMPKDTLGSNWDSVIVANSGGTNLSIVAVDASRVEARRHRLPNYLVQTVKTATNSGGGLDIIITEYDLSDRPLYLGATCRAGGVSACDSVLAVYSTTPTPAQPQPFTNRGYMAWDNIRSPAGAPSGHFFYEVGTAASAAGTDTLQIIAVRDTAPGLARRDTILGAGVGTIGNLTELAFQDSTFVRNSGDFNHVLVGEGGLDQGFARALTFDARVGAVAVASATCPPPAPLDVLKCTGVFDQGVSEGIFVRDFVNNRASRVLSIATNFNGRTNLVRADSIYAFDFTLRQTGLMQLGGTNAGIDFPRENKFDAATRGTGGFGGSLNPNDRLLFAARPDANIEVFDTYFYGSVSTIPIRDPIIGPIRVATNGSGQRILVGVTASGVVVLRLPSINNTFPAPRPLTAATGSR